MTSPSSPEPLRTSAIIGELFPLLLLLVAVERVLSLSANAAVESAVGIVGSAALLVFAGYRTRRRGGPRRQATAVGFRLVILGWSLSVALTVLLSAAGVDLKAASTWSTVVQQFQQGPWLYAITFAVIAAVVVGFYLLEAWLCGAFGYWIAAD
jgi:hypothetical protein